ncbi:hypothetical protein [Streptomyces ficellus]|uniref:Uncharacterized protein n=1 Tax=Streptomyces ficellus TaxID=1977088 RepID=A0A6I6FAD2_9ACTN|nr:hypothetical protein [Streptomyces ficellus]QGV77142.1 hypothetical protein EIZ62_01925 [Streptomyces ficellus]
MYVEDHEHPRVAGAEPASAQSIMESFQRVLDDLDAARAELHNTAPFGGSTGGPLDGPHPRTPPPVTVEPLWARDTRPPQHGRYSGFLTEAQKRGRWVGACGVGAAGGLLVVSTMLANGTLTAGEPGTPGQPVRPPQQDVSGSKDTVREQPGAPRRTYRIPRLQPGGGGYGIEVQAVAARFQDPPAALR